MKIAERFPFLHRISSQIIILLILSSVIFHLCMTTAAFLSHPPEFGPSRGALGQLVKLADLIDRTARAMRPQILAWIRSDYPWLDPQEFGVPSQPGDDPDASRQLGALTPFQPAGEFGADRIGFRLRDGSSIIFSCPHCSVANIREILTEPPNVGPMHHGGPPASAIVVPTLFGIAISFALFLLWAARGVIAPLRQFAAAADAFSLDATMQPLSETGPFELRTVAHALNRMRDRIKQMVEERTRMLAAIGHDLRTPITRMRLRAEYIEPFEIRRLVLRDLEQMSAMAHSALSFIRDGVDAQRSSLLDLGTLLQTVRDEFADMGYDVVFENPDRLSIEGNSEELHRAVTNLVSNGVTFGNRVMIDWRHLDAEHIAIEIADDGPGIPETKKEAMFVPFVRGDELRDVAHKSKLGEGFGLGLPIVQAIVAAHRGSLVLDNREPHGLVARIILPLRQA